MNDYQTVDPVQPGLLVSPFTQTTICDDYSFTFSHITHIHAYGNACVFYVNYRSNFPEDSE